MPATMPVRDPSPRPPEVLFALSVEVTLDSRGTTSV